MAAPDGEGINEVARAHLAATLPAEPLGGCPHRPGRCPAACGYACHLPDAPAPDGEGIAGVLAEALCPECGHLVSSHYRGYCGNCDCTLTFADALAPTVARWLAEARGEALRDAADDQHETTTHPTTPTRATRDDAEEAL